MHHLHTPEQVISDLKQQNYKALYFLQGSEKFYIDKITDYVTNLIPKEERPLNLQTLYDKKQPLQEILLEAQQVPMLGRKKVLIVKDAQQLLDLRKTRGKDQLIRYIKRPSHHTILIFHYVNNMLATYEPLFKALTSQSMLVSCTTPYPNQIPFWIKNHIHKKGYHITQEACLELHIRTGNNLQLLANQLEKIVINLPKGTQIVPNTITQYIDTIRSCTLFDLEQALSQKQHHKIYHIVQNLMQNPKKHPISLTISSLTSFFTKLLQLRYKPQKNLSDVAKLLQTYPYLAKRYVQACKHYTLENILRIIQHLHEADLQNKGINYPPLPQQSILKELITKILHSALTTSA